MRLRPLLENTKKLELTKLEGADEDVLLNAANTYMITFGDAALGGFAVDLLQKATEGHGQVMRRLNKVVYHFKHKALFFRQTLTSTLRKDNNTVQYLMVRSEGLDPTSWTNIMAHVHEITPQAFNTAVSSSDSVDITKWMVD